MTVTGEIGYSILRNAAELLPENGRSAKLYLEEKNAFPSWFSTPASISSCGFKLSPRFLFVSLENSLHDPMQCKAAGNDPSPFVLTE